MDELYSAFIIKPFQAIGGFLFQFDQRIVDGTVNGAGLFTIWASGVKLWIDKNIVDGLVNLTGYLTTLLSAIFRRIQTGFVQHYLLIVFIGVLVLIVLELRP